MSTRTRVMGSFATLALGAASVTVVTAAPAFAVCDYPNSIVTTTTASGPAKVPYGRAAKLAAVVDSGSGTPTGNVKFRFTGTSFTKTRALSSGAAHARLGNGLPAQTVYTYTARYLGDCDWAASSDSGTLKVVKAGTGTLALAPDTASGDPVDVKVKVVSRTSGTPHGKVRVALKYQGEVVRRMLVSLSQGVATANFGPVHRTGTWTFVARYRGSHNFKRSLGSGSFEVS